MARKNQDDGLDPVKVGQIVGQLNFEIAERSKEILRLTAEGDSLKEKLGTLRTDCVVCHGDARSSVCLRCNNERVRERDRLDTELTGANVEVAYWKERATSAEALATSSYHQIMKLGMELADLKKKHAQLLGPTDRLLAQQRQLLDEADEKLRAAERSVEFTRKEMNQWAEQAKLFHGFLQDLLDEEATPAWIEVEIVNFLERQGLR